VDAHGSLPVHVVVYTAMTMLENEVRWEVGLELSNQARHASEIPQRRRATLELPYCVLPEAGRRLGAI